MGISIAACICLFLFWSWQRAERLGLPWFSLGGQQRPTYQLQFRQRTRTGSIKPKSPWLKSAADQSKQPVNSYRAQRRPSKKNEAFPAAAFHRLYQLTHNVEIAERLVQNLTEKHPNRDLLWCIQKAIYDIERDR